MKTELLINAVVQQTMIFVARLATAGGVKTPLAQVADKVFLELTRELQNQGVSKKVIADMFGMALRTYHRRAKEVAESGSQPGRSIWEAVLEFIRDDGPVSASRIYLRFKYDHQEVVAGVLNDLVDSALAYRTGRGDSAVYRPALASDFGDDDATHQAAIEHLIWLSVYRRGPLSLAEVSQVVQLPAETCARALAALQSRGNVECSDDRYHSLSFEVPVGQSLGWEAAVLDHYQALVNAIAAKISAGASGSRFGEVTGGATYSFDVPGDHPLRERVLSLLTRTRTQMEELRAEVDAINQTAAPDAEPLRVVFYVGQYVQS
ncbi:MAG TPA: hypothetical protein VHM70_00675 [Polyangiaceae bacterium]|nr:hypothetical protein [Polyangiaceae bacterium]